MGEPSRAWAKRGSVVRYTTYVAPAEEVPRIVPGPSPPRNAVWSTIPSLNNAFTESNASTLIVVGVLVLQHELH